MITMTRVPKTTLARELDLLPVEVKVIESLGLIEPVEIFANGKLHVYDLEESAKRIRDAAKPGSRLHRHAVKLLESKGVNR
jgi:hypothetical protein